MVDDHPVIRETLSAFIERTDDLEMCGTATSGEKALARIVAGRCDLVLVDLSMPGMSGIDLVRRLREQPNADAPYSPATLSRSTYGIHSRLVHEDMGRREILTLSFERYV